MIARGQLWWADLGLPRGSAPALRRPVLVVSADRYNASALRTVVVVILTATTRLGTLPGNVMVPVDLGLLPEDSVINITQVATVDRHALEELIGELPDWLLAQADVGLAGALGL
ncbi:MAG TPA: type II toxin-antitoxin system PemK/MazF family toxin [Pseudonocardiaceae bacterium]|nr:type II toxin-antitoxin system PemK/MazF family toxin [Pseudonocardiaceae bacterium]